MQIPLLSFLDDNGTDYRVKGFVRREGEAEQSAGGPVLRVTVRHGGPYETFSDAQDAQFALHKTFLSQVLPTGAQVALPLAQAHVLQDGTVENRVTFEAFMRRKDGFPVAADAQAAQLKPIRFMDVSTAKEVKVGKLIAKRKTKTLGQSAKSREALERRYVDFLGLRQYSVRKQRTRFYFVLTYYEVIGEEAPKTKQIDLFDFGNDVQQVVITAPTDVTGLAAAIMPDVEEGSGRVMGD